MKRLMGLMLAASLVATLGGCVYGPGYYQRPGVAYDDEYSDYGYAPGYASYGYGYGYGYPGYGYGYYGGPVIGLGFSGGYYYGGHSHHHHYRGASPGTYSGGHHHGH